MNKEQTQIVGSQINKETYDKLTDKSINISKLIRKLLEKYTEEELK